MSRSSPIERLARCMRGEVAPGLDWVELVRTAGEEKVIPALYRRLLRSGCAHAVDEDALEHLRAVHEANCERNRRLWALFVEVAGALNAAGIVPVLIKGGSDLARQDDPGKAPRMLSDLDIVVARAELPDTQRVFSEIGLNVEPGTRHAHSPGSYRRMRDIAPIDLHVSLPGRVAGFAPDGEAVRILDHERDGVRFGMPDPSLHFVITLAHEMLHDRVLMHGTTQMRYLVDLAEQAGDPHAAIDWEWIAALRADRSFELALDVQRLMLRHLLATELGPLPEPGRRARWLHARRVFKMRRPELGYLEWRIVRRGLRLVRHPGLQHS